MGDVDTSRERIESLASDLDAFGFVSEAATLRALLAEVEALRKERDRMRETLEGLMPVIGCLTGWPQHKAASAALAPAAEKKRDA